MNNTNYPCVTLYYSESNKTLAYNIIHNETLSSRGALDDLTTIHSEFNIAVRELLNKIKGHNKYQFMVNSSAKKNKFFYRIKYGTLSDNLYEKYENVYFGDIESKEDCELFNKYFAQLVLSFNTNIDTSEVPKRPERDPNIKLGRTSKVDLSRKKKVDISGKLLINGITRNFISAEIQYDKVTSMYNFVITFDDFTKQVIISSGNRKYPLRRLLRLVLLTSRNTLVNLEDVLIKYRHLTTLLE